MEFRIGNDVYKYVSHLGYGGQNQICHASRGGRNYIVKYVPRNSSQLDSEIRIYNLITNPRTQADFLRTRPDIDYLGIPEYYGSGISNQYRFIVLEALGISFDKIPSQLPMSVIACVGYHLVSDLEYLHSLGLIYGDLKNGNITLGPCNSLEIFLIDYGISTRYIFSGKHVEYKKEGPADGTIEYLSIDGHERYPISRRGDLESLGYLLVQWYWGELPWKGLKSGKEILTAKLRFWENINLTDLHRNLKDYLIYIHDLGYDEEPDYVYLRRVLARPDY